MNRLFHCPEDNDKIRELCSRVEYTELLNDYSTHAEVKKACEDVLKYKIGLIVPYHQYLPEVLEYLKGSNVKVVQGYNDMASLEERLYSMEHGFEMGCAEVDAVARLSLFFDKKYDEFQKECRAIAELAAKYGAASKLIIDTGFLTDDEKILMARLGLDAGMTFIKTCVGLGTRPGRGTFHDVLLLKETFGERIKIKATGSIASAEDAYTMLEAGADRVAIKSHLIEELEEIGYDPNC